MNEILIKYFSARMLSTLDMNQLFRSVFETFGECQIEFVPMAAHERAQASTQVAAIEAVNERYWIFHRVEDQWVRQRDLEATIVRKGQK
jgi:hypothetical protein